MSAAGRPAPRTSAASVLSWTTSLFTLKPELFHPVYGLVMAAVLYVPLLLFKAAGHEGLWLSFSYGIIVPMACDYLVSDAFTTRMRWSAVIVLVGALLTALGYVLGGASWPLVALAVFVSTLLGLLIAANGQRMAVAGVMLNIWFLIALSVTSALHQSPAQTWPLAGPQALAWLAGGVLWLVGAWVVWMVQRARARQPVPDTAPQNAAVARLSRPQVSYAVLAAVAVALATAVAWGFGLPNADWMPVATIIAIKPSLEASTYVGGQRVAGTLVGAILATILLYTVHDRTLLEVLLVAAVALGNAAHDMNYALYCVGITTNILIWLGLPHPASVTDTWQRVAWTLIGAGIAVAVMLLADRTDTSAPLRAARAWLR
jgi:hypothetical protein